MTIGEGRLVTAACTHGKPAVMDPRRSKKVQTDRHRGGAASMLTAFCGSGFCFSELYMTYLQHRTGGGGGGAQAVEVSWGNPKSELAHTARRGGFSLHGTASVWKPLCLFSFFWEQVNQEEVLGS